MRDSQGITIENAIAHLVNPRKTNGYILSERTLPLKSHKQLSTYFCRHIESSLADAASSAARFSRNGSTSILHPICCKLLKSKSGFVKNTGNIAAHLHSIITSDQRISPGTLLICTYRSSCHPNVKRFVAILKLDPSDVFQPITKKDRLGRKFVTFKTISNVIPSERERLQKCAFIREIETDSTDYDMMILDLQKRGSNEPARFFRRDFLSAEPYLDARALTSDFYFAAIDGVNKIRSMVGSVKAEQVKKAIDVAVTSATINVEDWLSNLTIKQAAKNVLKASLSPATPNKSFHPDPQVSKRLIQTRVFRGDHGFKLSVPAAHFSELITQEEKSDANGTFWELIIRTKTLEELAR